MNILEEINKAAKKGKRSPILKFGNLRIIKPLGVGGQGSVFLAENRIKKQFAVKFAAIQIDSSKEGKEKNSEFLRGVEFLSKLAHKNISNIYSGGYASFSQKEAMWEIIETTKLPKALSEISVLFYVMDYIPQSLKSLFAELKKQTKNPKDSVSLFEKMVHQICDALSACHKIKIAHRDIKPENILFRESDETFVLADFGKARHTDSIGEMKVKLPPYKNPVLDLQKRWIPFDLSSFSTVCTRFLDLDPRRKAPASYSSCNEI